MVKFKTNSYGHRWPISYLFCWLYPHHIGMLGQSEPHVPQELVIRKNHKPQNPPMCSKTRNTGFPGLFRVENIGFDKGKLHISQSLDMLRSSQYFTFLHHIYPLCLAISPITGDKLPRAHGSAQRKGKAQSWQVFRGSPIEELHKPMGRVVGIDMNDGRNGR